MAFQYRGRCFQSLFDYQRALYDFTMAIKIDEKSSDLIVQAQHFSNFFAFKILIDFAGQCHQELGQLEEALKHFEIAVKKDPTNGNYYYNRALIKSKLEKLEPAIEDYKKALEYLSDSYYIFQATYNKGICLRKLGKLTESITELKKAVEFKNE